MRHWRPPLGLQWVSVHKRALQQLDGTAQLHSHDDLLRQASSRAPNFLVPLEHQQLTPGLSGGASSRCSPTSGTCGLSRANSGRAACLLHAQ